MADRARRVTLQEQSEMEDLRRPQSNYLPARRSSELTVHEQTLMSTAAQSAGQMIAHRQMHTARSDDNAVTQAVGSLIYSAAYIVAMLFITTGLLLIAWMAGVASFPVLFYCGLIFWGVTALFFLLRNRAQGLWHSATGIAHHEIESRERVALETMYEHADLIRERWRMERDA